MKIQVCKASELYLLMVATSCCEVINLSKCYTTHIVSSGYMHHLTGYKVVKLQKC